MKGLEVTENDKEIKLKGVWGELEQKIPISETISHKTFEANSSFHVKEHTAGKF